MRDFLIDAGGGLQKAGLSIPDTTKSFPEGLDGMEKRILPASSY